MERIKRALYAEDYLDKYISLLFLGSTYSQIYEDLPSDRRTCHIFSQPKHRRKSRNSVNKKHRESIQSTRRTFGQVLIPCFGQAYSASCQTTRYIRNHGYEVFVRNVTVNFRPGQWKRNMFFDTDSQIHILKTIHFQSVTKGARKSQVPTSFL